MTGNARRRARAATVRHGPALLLGLVAGLTVGARAFGPDLLLNWDQVIGSTIPVPPGVFGHGTELPRRVPFYLPLAAASRLLGGPSTVALLLIGSVAGAVVGCARMVGGLVRNGRGFGLIAGLAYGLSPFLLTRAAVGHLPLVAATAMLPWAFTDASRNRRLLWWGIAFAFTGSSGAVLGLVPLALAAITNPGPNRLRRLAALAATQALWVVPGVLVLLGDGVWPEAATDLFRTRVEGVGGAARVLVGGGFFLVDEDVAARAPLAAAGLGLVAAMAAALGFSHRGNGESRLVERSGLIGLALMVMPALPIVGGWWNAALIGPGSVLRESHKFWPLVGVALIASIARLETANRGARLGVFAAVPLVVAAAWPGLFGADGRLVAAPKPPALAAAIDELQADPGDGIVLPWRRYQPSALASGRTVLTPFPWIVSPDLAISGDPFISRSSPERGDAHQGELESIDAAVRAGEPVAPRLRALGLRWVLIAPSPDKALYRRLASEAGIEVVVDGSRPESLWLLRVSRPTKSE